MQIRTLLAAGTALALLSTSALAQAVLITNALVVDGTGVPARPAEVRIVDGKIYSIGR